MNIKKHGYFFVGKEPYISAVKFLIPEKVTHKEPIILIHGGVHSSLCYMTTDKQIGWAELLVEKGYRVYLLDWPGSGRSPLLKNEDYLKLSGNIIVKNIISLLKKISKPVILFTHSMSGPYGWKVAELAGKNISKIIAIAPGLPGNLEKVRKGIFTKNILKVKHQVITYNIDMKKKKLPDDNFILKKLIGKKNTQFDFSYYLDYKKSLTSLSPQLIKERLNVDDSQLKVKSNKIKSKILVIIGEHDADHPKSEGYLIKNFFKNVTYTYLPEYNIFGNGHMLMIEKNNKEILNIIYQWLNRK